MLHLLCLYIGSATVSPCAIEIKRDKDSEQYQHHHDAKEATDKMLDKQERYDDGEYRYDV